MCMICRSLFVLLYFFFWPLWCLFFVDLRILITPLVSANSSSCLQIKKGSDMQISIKKKHFVEFGFYQWSSLGEKKCPMLNYSNKDMMVFAIDIQNTNSLSFNAMITTVVYSTCVISATLSERAFVTFSLRVLCCTMFMFSNDGNLGLHVAIIWKETTHGL